MTNNQEFKPLYDRVIVEQIKEEESKGGIKIPTMMQDRRTPIMRGKVLAVGEGKILPNNDRQQMSCKVGDVVLFTGAQGDDIEYGGKSAISLRDNHIFAVVEE